MKNEYSIFLILLVLFINCSDYKSSKNIDYIVDVYFDETTLTISGTAEVIISNNKSTESLVFNIWANVYRNGAGSTFYHDAEKVHVFENPKSDMGIDDDDLLGWIEILSVKTEDNDLPFIIDDTILIIDISGLEITENIKVLIEFKEKVPKVYHRSGYYNDVIWLGNWLPTLPVYENGSWKTNEYYADGDPFYSLNSDYDVTINTPSEYTVVGTGRENAVIMDNRKITNIKEENIRDHAVLIAKDINSASVTSKNNITFNFYSYTLSAEIMDKYLIDVLDML